MVAVDGIVGDRSICPLVPNAMINVIPDSVRPYGSVPGVASSNIDSSPVLIHKVILNEVSITANRHAPGMLIKAVIVDFVISGNVEVTRLGKPIVNVEAISIVIMDNAPLDTIIGCGDIHPVADEILGSVMDVQIEKFIMSGTSVVGAQLNAVCIWILDF